MSARHRTLASIITVIAVMASALLFGLASTGAGSTPDVAAPADVVFRSVTVIPSEDTSINAWDPTRNYADLYALTVRSGDIASAIMKFDLASIPFHADVAVAQATLKLFTLDRTNDAPIWVSAYAINRSWSARAATWESPWATPGCNAVPADRSGSGSPDSEITDDDAWVYVDVTDIVRAWLSGATGNNGLILKGMSSSSVAYDLASSDHPNAERRPRLQVVFTIIPTPTPTATPTATPVQPMLSVEKTCPTGPLVSGESSITYSIAVRSTGTQDAQNVVITDVLPLGTVFLSATEGGIYSSSEHIVTWNLGTMAMGRSKTLELRLGLAAWVKEAGTLVNAVRASCTGCTLISDYCETIVVSATPTPTPTWRMMYFVEIYRQYLR